MKLCGCHSENNNVFFENPFYKLAALSKKLEYASRFHVNYRQLLFTIQAYTIIVSWH